MEPQSIVFQKAIAEIHFQPDIDLFASLLNYTNVKGMFAINVILGCML